MSSGRYQVKWTRQNQTRFEIIITFGEDNGWIRNGNEEIIEAKHVSVCSGHHVQANHVSFQDQSKFNNRIFHSEAYKNALHNKVTNGKVLVVGIGNSAVDTAVNLVDLGKNRVTISTRSGAWIYPNYMFGLPTDHFASRAFLKWVPAGFANWFTETVVSCLVGSPKWWGLNPKNRILQSQPTVSPTLIHHIQRGHINIQPNIKKFTDKGVVFENGCQDDFDTVIMCTGWFSLSYRLYDESSTVTHDLSLVSLCFKCVSRDEQSFIYSVYDI